MKLVLRGVFGLVGLVLLAGGVLLVGCGGDDDDDDGAAPASTAPAATSTAAPSAATLSVSIVDFAFQPATLGVRPGQAVTVNVKNDGKAPHTFTIDGLADTQRMDAGSSKPVTFTPTTAGTLTYYCTVHGKDRMSGQLTVSASGAAQPGTAPAGGEKAASPSGQDSY